MYTNLIIHMYLGKNLISERTNIKSMICNWHIIICLSCNIKSFNTLINRYFISVYFLDVGNCEKNVVKCS